MKKKVIALALTAALFAAVVTAVDSTPSIIINGNRLETDPLIYNDRIYVPLRASFESVGGTVSWDDATRTANISIPVEENASNMIATVSKSVVAIVGNYTDGKSSAGYSPKGTAHGTGVIIKSGGEILTNAHVVKNLEQIIVIMNDGTGYEARLKYIDETIDLAVVKIDKIGLPTIKFADKSKIEPGDTVFAIGTPISLSLRNSVSKGIVSGIDCNVFGDYRLLQTDAAINPGNSGGPLVNTAGELVGINSAKFSSVSIEGMGFSIPVDTVKYTLNQFDTYGKIRRAYTGITFEESWASEMGFPSTEGLTVTKVEAASAGSTAGVQTKDVLTAVGDVAVHSMVDLNEALKNYAIGSDIPFQLTRGETKLTVNVKAIEK